MAHLESAHLGDLLFDELVMAILSEGFALKGRKAIEVVARGAYDAVAPAATGKRPCSKANMAILNPSPSSPHHVLCGHAHVLQ